MARTRSKGKRTITLAQRQADPGLRSRLPMNQLTAAQQGMRKARLSREALDRNPLYQPSVPLSGHSLSQSVDQLVAGQYDPQERALKQDIANTSRQGAAVQGRAGSYYQALAEQEQRGIQTQAALGQMTAGRMDAVGAQAQAANAAAMDAEKQRLASDTAVRGGGLQDTSTLKEVGIAGQNQANAQAQAATTSAQGSQEWGQFANALAQTRGLRGGEIQGQLANRIMDANAKTTGKLGDLVKERGGTRAETLLKLRQQGFENIATAKTLDLKASDLVSSDSQAATNAQIARQRIRQAALDSAAGRDITARGQDVTARGQDITSTNAANRLAETQRNHRWTESHPGSRGAPRDPLTGLTTAQKTARSDHMRRDVDKATSLFRAALARHPGDSGAATRVLQTHGVPNALINVARDLSSGRTGGRLSKKNYDTARRAGLRVPPEWRPKAKKP